MPLYEYVCENQKCSKHKEIQTQIKTIAERKNAQCEECDIILKHLISGMSRPHISWSLWRV